MADREIINVGSTVDDGTGDLLRLAFQKVNNNFEQVWEKTSVNSNLNISEFTVNSDGDLILNPADEVKIAKALVINSDKGNYDTTIHGDSIDNVLFVDASAGRVGILNNSPTVALDVTGSVKVSNTLTTMALNTTGHTVLGDAVDDTVTFNARVNSSIQPFGTQTLGTVTNRWDNAYLRNVDVSGTISGTIAGTLPNDIDNDITTSNRLAVTDAEITELLVTGNLTVQGTTTTLQSTEVLVDNSIVFEGVTDDDYETTITVTDPTADRTITFQDADGTVAFLSDIVAAGGLSAGDNVSELVNDAGYLTAETSHADVLVDGDFAIAGIMTTDGAGVYGAIVDNSANWDTAFSWGDHSTAGYSTFDGQYSSLTGAPTIPADVSDLTDTTNLLVHYADADVDAHLNQTNPTSGYVLSWNGSDYAWVAPSAGGSYGDTDVATYLNGNLDSHIIPDTNSTYDIGSAEYKIRHLYLSDNSLKFVDNSDPLNPIEFPFGRDGITGRLTYNGGDLLDWDNILGKPTIPADISDLTDTGDLLGHFTTADVDAHLNQTNPTSGHVLSWNGADYAWVAQSAGGGGTFDLAGNTGTHTFDTATETLTFLGTTGQINAGIAANNVTLELDTNLTGLTTINTHTIPGGTGTLALTSDIPAAADQTVNTTDNVTFNDVTVDGTLTTGNFTLTGTGAVTLTSGSTLALNATDEVTTNAPFRLVNLTGAEITALTAQPGMVVYNTTTNKAQCYNGTVWADMF